MQDYFNINLTKRREWILMNAHSHRGLEQMKLRLYGEMIETININ